MAYRFQLVKNVPGFPFLQETCAHKIQQGTDKFIEHDGSTVSFAGISRYWCQLCIIFFITFYL